MFAKSLKNLQLDEHGKIGYTYKCLGAGIWSLRQDDFRAAIEDVAFEVRLTPGSNQYLIGFLLLKIIVLMNANEL